MEQFEIYTLGAGFYLEKIFNALNMILSGNYSSILKTASLGAVVILAIRSGISNDFKEAVKWFMGVAVLVALFLNQKATVHIIDTLPGPYGEMAAPRTVQNVPWGLALIGSVTSQVGNSITESFNTSLAGVFNNPDYQPTGILFGSKLVEDTSKMRLNNVALKQFMLKFYKQCIVPDINMGLRRVNGYTIKDLANSENILEFLSDHSSKARLIYLPSGIEGKTDEKNENNIPANDYISCNKAAKYIEKSINSEIDKKLPILANSFVNYFYPNQATGNKNEFFKSVLAGSYGIFIKKSSQNAKDILLQNMAINAIGDSIDSSVYNKVATETATKAAYYSVAQMAQKFVPILRAVLECLFYGVFPLVLILMVTPIGLQVLKNYSFGFVYLQLWQPMYAILFCIAASWGKSYSGDITAITLGSHAHIARINEEISSVAGYMLTLVPVLSLFITKGMVASMGNLASSITYIPQSTAVQNAEAAVKGNYQLGTTNIDTHSSNMSTSNKHDDNYSWMSGMKSFSMQSGSTQRIMSNGKDIIDMSGSMNNLGGLAKVDMNSAIGSRFDQSINDNMSSAERHASNMVESTSAGLGKILGYDQSFGKNSSNYKDFYNSRTSEERQSIEESRNYVDRVAQENGISKQDAVKVAVAGHFGIGSGVAGVKLSAGLGLEGTTSESKNEGFNKSFNSSEDERFSKNLNAIQGFSIKDSHQEGNNITSNMTDSIKSDFIKSNLASMERSKSMDRVHSLQDSKASFQQNSSNISQDYTNQFADIYKNKYGTEEFDNTLRNNPEKSNQWLNEFLDSKMGGTSSGIHSQFNQARVDFDNKLGAIESLHGQNTNFIENAQIANNGATTESAPANFRKEIEDKGASSEVRKKVVNQKFANNNNLLNDKKTKLENKGKDLESKVADSTDNSALGSLLSQHNPFNKKE